MSLKCIGNICSSVVPKKKKTGMEMRKEEQEGGLWTQFCAAHNCHEYMHTAASVLIQLKKSEELKCASS